MTDTSPTLHMLCGKIGAGKSTLAHRLAQSPNTVLLVEDAWLGTLFADQMKTPADYLRYAGRLKAAMGPHVLQLLTKGISVVLDFPANTVEMRAWMRGLLDQTEAAHVLHVLDVPDEVCLARLHARNAAGTHPFKVTDAQFREVTRHHQPPETSEGFVVKIHTE
ncbi:MAG: ATP-binding protein [Pseudomonadota bacterium]